MKNVLILTAMFLSSAALADSTTVTQPVNATVQNTCITVVTTDDVNGTGEKESAPATQLNRATPMITYKANAKSNTVSTTSNGVAGAPAGGLYAFRCTSGTNFTAHFGNAGSSDTGATGTLTLTSPSKNTSVTADFKITRIDLKDGVGNGTYGPFGGDVHAADADFSIAAGQWSAMAASDYTGNLVVNVEFN